MAIKFFNNVAVDSDVLYVDAVNNEVGINNSNPSHALDVSGTVATDSGFLAVATLPSLTFVDSSGGGEIYTSTGSMYFKTGVGTPTVKMAILSGGNVGVGTTTPRGALDVNGPLSVIGGTWTSGTTGADSNASAGIVLRRGKKLFSGIPNGTDEDFYLRSLLEQTSSNEIIIGQGGTALVSDISLKPGSNGNIKFFGSGSEDMRIDSSGNVGIGLTNTNSVKLAITGNSGFPATSGTTQAGLLRLKASNNATLDMGANGTFSSGWLQVTDVADLSNTYDLLLQPNGGDVGIGVQFPDELLHIKGSTANTA